MKTRWQIFTHRGAHDLTVNKTFDERGNSDGPAFCDFMEVV